MADVLHAYDTGILCDRFKMLSRQFIVVPGTRYRTVRRGKLTMLHIYT